MRRIGRRLRPGMRHSLRYQMESGDFPVPVLHLKFGENAGVVAYDSSPEGNDGDVDGATWVRGYLGPGLDFDGLDNYVKVDPDSSLDVTEMTLLMAVKPADIETVYTVSSRLSNVLRLILNEPGDGDIKAVLKIDGTQRSLRAVGELTAGEFQQVAMSFDGANIRLFYNGLRVKISSFFPGALTTSVNPLWIGVYGTSVINSQYLEGILDEVLLYDVGLTELQVQELYDGIW